MTMIPEPAPPGPTLRSAIVDRPALLEMQLETLFRVSQELSRPCPLAETLAQVLNILHDHGELLRGVVSLVDPDSGALLVSAVHGQSPSPDRELSLIHI